MNIVEFNQLINLGLKTSDYPKEDNLTTLKKLLICNLVHKN